MDERAAAEKRDAEPTTRREPPEVSLRRRTLGHWCMKRSSRYTMMTVWAILATSTVSAIATSLLPFSYAQGSYSLLPVGQTVYSAVWHASPDKKPVEAAVIVEVGSAAVELACLAILTMNLMSNWASLGWFLQIKAFQFAFVAWLANVARLTDWITIAGRQLAPLLMSLSGTCLVSPPVTFYHAAALYGTAIYTAYVFPAASTGNAFRTRPAAALLIVWFGVVLGVFPAIAPLIQPLGIGPWGFAISIASGICAVGALLLRKLWRMTHSSSSSSSSESLVEVLAEALQGLVLPIVLMSEMIFILAESIPDGCPAWGRGGDPIGSPPAGTTFPQGFNVTTTAQIDRLISTVSLPASLSLSSAAAFVIVFATLLVEIQGRLSYLRARDIIKGAQTLREAVGSVSHAARGPLNAAALCLALLQKEHDQQLLANDDDDAAGALNHEDLVEELRAAVQRSQRHLDGLLMWEKTSLSDSQKVMDSVHGDWKSLDETLRAKLLRAYAAEAKTSGVEFNLQATSVEPIREAVAGPAYATIFTDHDRLLGLMMNMLGHAFASVATAYEHHSPRVVFSPVIRSLTAAEAASSLVAAFEPGITAAGNDHPAASGLDKPPNHGGLDQHHESVNVLRMLQITVRYTAGPNTPTKLDMQSGAVWKMFGAAQRTSHDRHAGRPTPHSSTTVSTMSPPQNGSSVVTRRPVTSTGHGIHSTGHGTAAFRVPPAFEGLTDATDSAVHSDTIGARRRRQKHQRTPIPELHSTAPSSPSLTGLGSPPTITERGKSSRQPSSTHSSSSHHQQGAVRRVDLSLPIVHAVAVGALGGIVRMCQLQLDHSISTHALSSPVAGASAASGIPVALLSESRLEVEVTAAMPVICQLSSIKPGNMTTGYTSVEGDMPSDASATCRSSLEGVSVDVCDDDDTSRLLLLRYLKRQKVSLSACGAAEGFSDGADVLTAIRAAVVRPATVVSSAAAAPSGDAAATSGDAAATSGDAAATSGDAAATSGDHYRIPDVLLLDSHMRQMSGMDTLKALSKLKASGPPKTNSDEAWNRLYRMIVIIVTGDNPALTRAGFVAAGAYTVLGKPIDTAEARDVIIEALNSRPNSYSNHHAVKSHSPMGPTAQF